jgi:YidC/Oxa1 family membrane protein insertase
MDRKSLLILAVAMAVLILLSGLVNRLFPPIPVPPTLAAAAATNGTTNLAAAQAPFTNREVPIAPTPTTVSTMAAPTSTQPEVLLTASNSDLIFRFTSRGGGLKDIELRDTNYPAIVHAHGVMDGSNYATLNHKATTPILAMSAVGWGGNDFELSRPSSNLVRAVRVLPGGLREVKEFNVGDIGTNYLFTANVRLENTSGAAVTIPEREVVTGTATAIGPFDDPNTIGVIWYNGDKTVDIGASWFANRTLGCIPGTRRTEYREGASNVVWAAMHSQYFTLTAIPAQPAPSVVIRSVSISPPDADGVGAGTTTGPAGTATLTNSYEGLQTAFVYPALTLAPGKSVEESFTFYAGPKEYNGLVKIGHFMGNNVDLAMGFTGYFGFSFFSKFLLISMNALHEFLGLHYALCIIAITVIIKLVFWPLTAASTRAQKRQQALAPQIKAIADKYKDDPLKKHEKTTALFKEHKINPLGSCLPMLITIPVFFGFYSMLRNSIELRGVPFLWAQDLTLPDTVLIIAGFHINPLPLLMTLTQLWQSHLTPPSPGMDPDQQKIMRWMPLMFLFIFYRMSAGLNLYYTVSNLLTIAQTTWTKMGADPAATPGRPVISAQKKR